MVDVSGRRLCLDAKTLTSGSEWTACTRDFEWPQLTQSCSLALSRPTSLVLFLLRFLIAQVYVPLGHSRSCVTLNCLIAPFDISTFAFRLPSPRPLFFSNFQKQLLTWRIDISASHALSLREHIDSYSFLKFLRLILNSHSITSGRFQPATTSAMASTNAAFASGRHQDSQLRRRNIPEITKNDGEVYNIDDAKKAFKVWSLAFSPVTSGFCSDDICHCSQKPHLSMNWNQFLLR